MKGYRMKDTRHGLDEEINLFRDVYHEPQNHALQAVCLDGTPWATFSVNPPHKMAENLIAIKDWSENEGVAELLIQEGLIEPEPVHWIPSGYVVIEIYRITDKFRQVFEVA